MITSLLFSSPPPTNSKSSTEHIEYNFYQMFSTKAITTYSGYIHYIMSGRENEPNITFYENQESVGYTTKNMYIFSKIHPYSGEYNGELVIENEPISKTCKPLFICIPLKTDPNVAKNVIDEIIENDDDTNNMEINLNPCLGLEATESYFYETLYNKVAVLKTPILVNSNFIGFNQGNIIEQPIQDMAATVAIPTQSIYYKKSATSSLPPPRPPSGIFDNVFIKTAPIIENFDTSYQWIECDSQATYDNNMPTYTIPVGSDTVNPREQILSMMISFFWIIVIILGVFLSAPIAFSIIAVRSYLKETKHEDRLTYINGVETFIFWILLIPAIVLLSIGTNNTIKCVGLDGVADCIKNANNLLISGWAFMSILIFFMLSLIYYKFTFPDFLGKDSNEIPYHKYTPQEIGFFHLLNFVQGFVSIGIFFSNIIPS